jgi:uncharacterized membrane protein YagU involved in acid resistance
MHMLSTTMSRGTLRPWQWIAIGGAVAGSLDILYAIVFWGLKGLAPARILQSVAAGVQDQDAAMAGGAPSATLGLLLHFVMALMMAGAYYLASRGLPALVRRPALFGALYGLLLYIVMNYIVVPLSAAGPGQPPSGLWMACSIVAHMLLVGIPCAYAARFAERAAAQAR